MGTEEIRSQQGIELGGTTLTRELLEGFLGQETRAERRVFERYRDVLTRRAERSPILIWLRSSVGAEDVLQEVWWRSLSAGFLSRFEDQGRGSLERALLRVLDNTLVDMARRHNTERRGGLLRRHDVELQPIQAAEHGPGTPVESPTSAARYSELVAACKEALEPDEWVLWFRIDGEGTSPSDLAAEFGVTPASVRGRLHRARLKLVQALGRRDPGSGA